MKKRAILPVLFVLLSIFGYAQQLPVGSCGIVHIYDASGNRIKRIYFCNNGSDPYPARMQLDKTRKAASLKDENLVAAEKPSQNVEIQKINALYPNPTTGKFSITFSKKLQHARILLTDIHGKVILKFTGSGYKIDFDLSPVPSGTYFIKILDSGNTISKKVIKQ